MEMGRTGLIRIEMRIYVILKNKFNFLNSRRHICSDPDQALRVSRQLLFWSNCGSYFTFINSNTYKAPDKLDFSPKSHKSHG